MSSRAIEGERADKSRESEYMISMKMSQKDVLKSAERESMSHECQLCTFTTVDHKKISTVVDHRG